MNRRDRRSQGIRGKLVDLEPVRLVVDAARYAGCLCDPPGIRFLDGPLRYGEISNVRVEHESSCPVLIAGLRRTAIVLAPDDEAAS